VKIKLPELVARRTSGRQEIPLLVKLYARRGKSGFIYLGHPLPLELSKQ